MMLYLTQSGTLWLDHLDSCRALLPNPPARGTFGTLPACHGQPGAMYYYQHHHYLPPSCITSRGFRVRGTRDRDQPRQKRLVCDNICLALERSGRIQPGRSTQKKSTFIPQRSKVLDSLTLRNPAGLASWTRSPHWLALIDASQLVLRPIGPRLVLLPVTHLDFSLTALSTPQARTPCRFSCSIHPDAAGLVPFSTSGERGRERGTAEQLGLAGLAFRPYIMARYCPSQAGIQPCEAGFR